MIVLSGKKAGSPITQTAPMTAPAVEPMPPMTMMATSDSETPTTKGESLNEIALGGPGQQPAAEAGDEPGQGERPQLGQRSGARCSWPPRRRCRARPA